jgi:hypothetical protein
LGIYWRFFWRARVKNSSKNANERPLKSKSTSAILSVSRNKFLRKSLVETNFNTLHTPCSHYNGCKHIQYDAIKLIAFFAKWEMYSPSFIIIRMRASDLRSYVFASEGWIRRWQKKIMGEMSYYHQIPEPLLFGKRQTIALHKSRGFRAHAYPFKCPDNTNANESLVNESK